jgi:hypothetical protein
LKLRFSHNPKRQLSHNPKRQLSHNPKRQRGKNDFDFASRTRRVMKKPMPHAEAQLQNAPASTSLASLHAKTAPSGNPLGRRSNEATTRRRKLQPASKDYFLR